MSWLTHGRRSGCERTSDESVVTPAPAQDSLALGRRTRARRYRLPPVHEVVIGVDLNEGVDIAALEVLPARLHSQLPVAQREERLEISTAFGPTGQPVLNQSRLRDGWRLRDEQTSRVLVARPSQIAMHAVRPGPWPSGEYAGWEAIYSDSLKIFETVAGLYGSAKLRRAGLRYLNRIAVPVNSEFEEWFTLGLHAPPFLQDEFAMNLRQSWARVLGDEDLSATIGLAIIQIPEPALQRGHVGFLLDIEVFAIGNKAPSLIEMAEWCRRAHDVEGGIFEWCITDNLRKRFEVIQ